MSESTEVQATLRSAKGITIVVTVHESYEYRMRLWLALMLFRLGAWVSGMGFEVQDGD